MDIYSLLILTISFLCIIIAFAILCIKYKRLKNHNGNEKKKLDKAKIEFLSLASHQLRTPLSTISWYAEMLLDEDVGKLSKKQKSYLEELYIANRRMIELVNSLLNVSRLETGTFIVNPEKCSLKKIIERVKERLEPVIKEKEVNLNIKIDRGVDSYIADPNLLEIIFKHLLSNAIRYNKIGGDVELNIREDVSHDKLVISVKDTGYGIPESQKNRIFDKLFRADNVRKMDTNGSGLGLFIVKSIVQYSGGNIWFESEEGNGTLFQVELPIDGMKKKLGRKELS